MCLKSWGILNTSLEEETKGLDIKNKEEEEEARFIL